MIGTMLHIPDNDLTKFVVVFLSCPNIFTNLRTETEVRYTLVLTVDATELGNLFRGTQLWHCQKNLITEVKDSLASFPSSSQPFNIHMMKTGRIGA